MGGWVVFLVGKCCLRMRHCCLGLCLLVWRSFVMWFFLVEDEVVEDVALLVVFACVFF